MPTDQRHHPTRTALAVLLATTTATACNPLNTADPAPGPTTAAPATPTPLPVGAGLCTSYDRALKPMQDARDYINKGKGVYPALIRGYALRSRDRLKTTADLATGQTRDAVTRTSAAVQTVMDKITDTSGTGKSLDLVPEYGTLSETIAPIAEACEAAGAALKTDL